MRSREFLTEWQKNYRVMHHGTSDIFLRNILKTGLKFDSGFRSWTGGAQGSDAELPSLGGVYFTDNITVAKTAAQAAARKHGGRPIIVDVYVTANFGYADEDLPAAVLMSVAMDRIREQNREGDAYYFQQALKRMPSGRFDKNIYAHSIEYFNAIDQILASHPDLNPMATNDLYQRELRKRLLAKQPALKTALEKISKSTRPRQIQYPHSTPEKVNVRIEKDIGYKGTTRIISIWDLLSAKILYQAPNMPLTPKVQAQLDWYGNYPSKYPAGHNPMIGQITDNRLRDQAEQELKNQQVQ